MALDGRKAAVAGDGFLLGPSVVDRVTPEMRLAKEEIFGPVLSVIRADDLDQALAIGRGCHYGNGASIFTRSGYAARPDLTRENLQATTQFLAGRWCINGCINVDYIQDTTDFIYGTPDFAGVKVVTAADVTDASFVEAAIEQLGAYQGGGIDAR